MSLHAVHKFDICVEWICKDKQRFIEIHRNYTFKLISSFNQMSLLISLRLELGNKRGKRYQEVRQKQRRGKETPGYSRACAHTFTAQRSYKYRASLARVAVAIEDSFQPQDGIIHNETKENPAATQACDLLPKGTVLDMKRCHLEDRPFPARLALPLWALAYGPGFSGLSKAWRPFGTIYWNTSCRSGCALDSSFCLLGRLLQRTALKSDSPFGNIMLSIKEWRNDP